MGKVKSIVLTVIISIVLAILGVVCFASFPWFGTEKDFSSVASLSSVDKDFGSGYITVIYPEGVISAEKYDNLSNTDKADYYSYKGIYISEEVIIDSENGGFKIEGNSLVPVDNGDKGLSETFIQGFENSKDLIFERFGKKSYTSLSCGIQDDYSIYVKVSGSLEDMDSSIERLLSKGTLAFYHSSKTSAMMKLDSSMVKSATLTKGGSLQINFTKEGRALFAEITDAVANNSDGDTSIYLKIRNVDLTPNGISISQKLDSSQIVFSMSSQEEAEDIAILINTTKDGEFIDYNFAVDNVVKYVNRFDSKASLLSMIALCGLALAGCIFFIVRFKGMGIAGTYSIITYVIAMTISLVFICGKEFSIAVILGLATGLAVLFACICRVFVNIEREMKNGKIYNSSVKSGFKKALAGNLDMHLLLIIATMIMIFASISPIASFVTVLLCGLVFSCLIAIFVNRFYLCMLSSLAKDKNRFCTFKKGVTAND